MNAKRYLAQIGLALALALFALGISTRPARADINATFTITDCATKQPLVGATITALTSFGAKVATTDANGMANLNPVQPGPYDHQFLIEKEGYESKTITQTLQAWTQVSIEECLVMNAIHVEQTAQAQSATQTQQAAQTAQAIAATQTQQAAVEISQTQQAQLTEQAAIATAQEAQRLTRESEEEAEKNDWTNFEWLNCSGGLLPMLMVLFFPFYRRHGAR